MMLRIIGLSIPKKLHYDCKIQKLLYREMTYFVSQCYTVGTSNNWNPIHVVINICGLAELSSFSHALLPIDFLSQWQLSSCVCISRSAQLHFSPVPILVKVSCRYPKLENIRTDNTKTIDWQ